MNEQPNKILAVIFKSQTVLQEIKTTMATKDDMAKIMKIIDELLGYARKENQKLILLKERLSHLEETIAKIKPLVGLA